MTKSAAAFSDHCDEERRQARQAISDFVDGAASGDTDRMSSSFQGLTFGAHAGGGWRRAFRQICRLPRIPSATRRFFLRVYVEYGSHIRQETADDLTFADGLRALLPPYKGGAVRLYRGESASSRQRRLYGSAWTATREVARTFAETGDYRCSKEGSVLLSAHVPSDAIICAPALLAGRYDEQEYIVDRRRLPKVECEEHFLPLNMREWDALRNRKPRRG